MGWCYLLSGMMKKKKGDKRKINMKGREQTKDKLRRKRKRKKKRTGDYN